MLGPNFKLLVKAFVKRNDKYLCIQRSPDDPACANEWDLPGGKLSFGEDIIDALKREIQEETGLEAQDIKPIYTSSLMYKKIFFVTIIYSSNYKSGNVKLSHEHQDYKWLSKANLNSVEFQDWIIPAFEQLG